MNDGQECPKCHQMTLQMGYGLAGGGMGPYEYCDNCSHFEKWQDPEMAAPSGPRGGEEGRS